MYIGIYFSTPEVMDRPDIESAIEIALPAGCEIVGGGSGIGMFNIDVAVPDRPAAMVIVETLRSLGVRPDTLLAFSDTHEKVRLDAV